MAWTLWVPVQNLKNFIITRPPTVIFALCLASFGLVTLSLAIYVKYSSAPLKNPDQMSWNEIGEKFGKLSFCLESPETAWSSPPSNASSFKESAILYDIDIDNVHSIKNITLISGILPSSYLGFEQQLNMSFAMSLIESHSKMCLVVYHPDNIPLPKVANPCSALKSNMFPKAAGASVHLSEEKRMQKIIDKCPEQKRFKLKLKENPEWTVELTNEDRSLINLHLMATTYFLLATFLMVFCFAVVRGGTRQKVLKLNAGQEQDKEALNP